MITKHLNHDYGASYPTNIGDRYYSQDLGRDFWYVIDRLGYTLKDILEESKLIISGGVVSKGAGSDEINVTECVGYIKYEVDIVDGTVAWALPPSFTQEDVEYIRVHMAAQVNFSDNVNNDNVTTNYVKLAYNDANGTQTRARAKASGSYNFDKTPSYTLTMDDVAPTAYEIELARFVTVAGSVPTTFDLSGRSKEFPGILYKTQTTITADYTILDYESYETYNVQPSSNERIIVTLPTVADHQGETKEFVYDSSNYGVFVLEGEGAEVIRNRSGSWNQVMLHNQGESIRIKSDGTYWNIVNGWNWHIESGSISVNDWTDRNMGIIDLILNDSTGFEQWEIVLESTSGYRGIIANINGNTLNIWYTDDGSGGVGGYFTNGRTITGQSSSATDTVNGNTKNVDSNVYHGLGTSIRSLRCELYWSTDGTDNEHRRASLGLANDSGSFGSVVGQVDTNNVSIEIGTAGLRHLTAARVSDTLNTDDYFYNIVLKTT